MWLQHRSASVDCAVSCPPFSNQALTFFFSDTNQAIIFKQRYAAEIEKLLRRLLEVRQLWLINHHRFLGCIALYLFGATHDDVTRPAKGFSGLSAGAAAVDMRTDLMRDGTRCYLGAVHGGTHIARPDRTVDSQGTGAKWRHATWLAFLVKLAIDHGRVLGLEALQRGDVRPEKVQIMIPKPRAVHFTAEEIKSEARRAPIFSLQDVGKLFRQLCVSEWQRLESVSHDENGSLSAVVQFETQKEADHFTARHRAFLLRKNIAAFISAASAAADKKAAEEAPEAEAPAVPAPEEKAPEVAQRHAKLCMALEVAQRHANLCMDVSGLTKKGEFGDIALCDSTLEDRWVAWMQLSSVACTPSMSWRRWPRAMQLLRTPPMPWVLHPRRAPPAPTPRPPLRPAQAAKCL